jgi:hypothetical protein
MLQHNYKEYQAVTFGGNEIDPDEIFEDSLLELGLDVVGLLVKQLSVDG